MFNEIQRKIKHRSLLLLSYPSMNWPTRSRNWRSYDSYLHVQKIAHDYTIENVSEIPRHVLSCTSKSVELISFLLTLYLYLNNRNLCNFFSTLRYLVHLMRRNYVEFWSSIELIRNNQLNLYFNVILLINSMKILINYFSDLDQVLIYVS